MLRLLHITRRVWSHIRRHLCAQQALVKGEQSLVDGENIMVPLFDKILDDDVELAAATQGISRPCNKVAGFLQAQFQRDGKGDGRRLGRLVVGIVEILENSLRSTLAFL